MRWMDVDRRENTLFLWETEIEDVELSNWCPSRDSNQTYEIEAQILHYLP
jgi:hypothetical protein